MASTLKHLRSATANKRPTASGLVDGQFAINTASGTPAIFFKDSNGGVVKVGPAHVGSAAPNAVPAGSAGNSLGELWVDNSLTTAGLKYYTGSTFVNLTPSGTETTIGLVELATPAETQTGTDGIRVVTPSGLQSKVSDSISTTSSTTIASATAVKTAYDLADAALPKTGGRVTGALEIGPTGSLVFEGSSDDTLETTIAVTDPTADRTITFPDITGTVVTTGDTGSITSTMILDGTILNADINASAAIAGTKISPDFGGQTIATTGIISAALGASGAPSITFTGDLNTGLYSPGADTLAFVEGGVEAMRIDSSGRLLVGTSSATNLNTSGAPRFAKSQIEHLSSDTNQRYGLGLLGNSANNGVGGGALTLTRNKASTSTNTVVASGDELGAIFFSGADGTAFIPGASIAAFVDGTPGSSDMPGRLVFSTTIDGTSFLIERMRIQADGIVTVGYPDVGGPDGALYVRGSNDGLANAGIRYETPDAALRVFNSNAGGNLDFVVDSGAAVGGFRFLSGSSGAIERMSIDGTTGNVGIGNTPTPLYRLLTEANANTIIPLFLQNTNNNFDTNPTVTQTVARLTRSGKIGSSFSSTVDFGISRYENVSTNARTQLDIKLSHGASSTPEVTVMSLRSNGNVGIGTTAPAEKLTVLGGAIEVKAVSNTLNNSGWFLYGNITAAAFGAGLGLFVEDAGNNAYALTFGTKGINPGTLTERMRITSNGYLRMAATNSLGIQFNGDTAAANALDDYEEGTWTPVIAGGTTAGTGTYSRQVGRYTKIGNRVCAEGIVTWSAHTGTGTIRISGLPFVVQNTTNYYSAAALYSSTITSPANTVLQAYAAFGQSQILIASVPVAGGTSASLAMDTAGEFLFSVNYII